MIIDILFLVLGYHKRVETETNKKNEYVYYQMKPNNSANIK